MSERTLIIPDIHQRALIFSTALKTPDWSRAVVLGDLFDDFYPRVDSACMANIIMDAKQKYGDDILFLVGNHDIPYYELTPLYRGNNSRKDMQKLYKCSGFSMNRAEKVGKVLDEDFIASCRLLTYTNGFLLSHAGILPHDLSPRPGISTSDALHELIEEALNLWRNFRTNEVAQHPFMRVGMSRGGRHSTGGVLWADWNIDFHDGLPWPQIVGHTMGHHVRRNNRSFCLDTGRHWAILSDENLEIYSLEGLEKTFKIDKDLLKD